MAAREIASRAIELRIIITYHLERLLLSLLGTMQLKEIVTLADLQLVALWALFILA